MSDLEKILQISSFQTLAVVIYLFLAFVTFVVLKYKKVNNNKLLKFAFLVSIVFGLISVFINVNQTQLDEIRIWLNIIPSIFIYFTLFFIPFLFGVKIITLLIIKEHTKKITTRV